MQGEDFGNPQQQYLIAKHDQPFKMTFQMDSTFADSKRLRLAKEATLTVNEAPSPMKGADIPTLNSTEDLIGAITPFNDTMRTQTTVKYHKSPPQS